MKKPRRATERVPCPHHLDTICRRISGWHCDTCQKTVDHDDLLVSFKSAFDAECSFTDSLLVALQGVGIDLGVCRCGEVQLYGPQLASLGGEPICAKCLLGWLVDLVDEPEEFATPCIEDAARWAATHWDKMPRAALEAISDPQYGTEVRVLANRFRRASRERDIPVSGITADSVARVSGYPLERVSA